MQHQFLASLLQKALSTNVLATPTSLYRLADAATSAVTTDPALGSVQSLVGLAASLRNLSLDRVLFTTYPYVKDPTNLNRLLPDQQRDTDLTTHLGADTPITQPPATGPAPTGAASSSGPVSAVGGHVRVLNATAVPGLAARVADTLRADGFSITAIGNAPYTGTRGTVITYAPALAQNAHAISQALTPVSGGAAPRLLASGHGDTITVVLGTTYVAAAPSANTPTTAGAAATTAAIGAATTATAASGDAVEPDRVASQSPCSGALGSP
jgi:hypothetical protein